MLPIEIPPLRERSEDLADLVQQHLHLLRRKRPPPGLLTTLARHRWPGNARELIQVLKRAGIHLAGPEIGREVEDLLTCGLDASEGSVDDRIARVEASLRSGACFWDTAWCQFLDRDLDREEL